MNVLGTFRLKPFATSTPLKPDFFKRVNQNGTSTAKPTIFGEEGISKESDISMNLQNAQSVKPKIKIAGKNRSRAYFDLSLSSDDDDDEADYSPIEKKKRPVIKIRKENSDRSILVALNNEESCEGVKENNKIKLCSPKCQKTRRKIPQRIENKECVKSSLRLRDHVTNSRAALHHLSPEQKKVTTSKCFQNKIEKKPVIPSKNEKPALRVSNENHQMKYGKRLLKGKNGDNQNSLGLKKRRQVEGNESLLILKEKLRNTSHQLFTDNTQEELINSLCLKEEEPEEGEESEMKLSKKSIRKTVSITKKNGDEGGKGEKEGRPKRSRQAPKKYWLVDEKPNSVKYNGEKQLKKWGVTKSSVPVLLNHESDDVATMPATQPGLGKEKDAVYLKVTKPEIHPEHPVFLPLGRVSYLENEFGHQVSQVCSMKNFKCGMFKLKPGSNFTWEKSQRRNHMGGVLVKGEMKMTIGGRERVLKEGDMALIPPLRECRASNTGGCDSLFYYWCGKFSE